MSDKKNQEFLRDPLKFIQQNAVDIRNFDKSISGRPAGVSRREEDQWFSLYGPDIAKQFREVYLDFEPDYDGPFMKWIQFVVMRLDRRIVTPTFLAALQTFKQQKAQIAFDILQKAKQNHANNPSMATQELFESAARSIEAFKARHEDRTRYFVQNRYPIPGYFFPYLSPPGAAAVTNGTWGIPQMGFVDVPRQSPKHPFVFTGQMNGCALVITESPLGNAYFRAYHYPNVSTYPRFKDQMLWQRKPRLHIWSVEEYASATEPDAFNFLHFDKGEWYLYCQPQSQVRYESRPYMQVRQKTVRGVQFPGRVKLSWLQNYWLDDYV